MPAFVISGTSSGSGKTLISLGIMEALRRRALIVQPFKTGPDYIDPGLHSLLLGRPSYNLDTWMMGVKGVRQAFARASFASGCAVVEGVMGLFDGRGGLSEEGSTAHLAKTLGLPIVLVANAEKAARSMGAVVKGFETFDESVSVKWVIFNKVGSLRHEKILRDSLRGSKVKVLGCVPRDSSLVLESRHLGLMTASDIGSGWRDFVKRAGDVMEESINLELLLRGSKTLVPAIEPNPAPAKRVRIAVALDRAFSFYYQENLDILSNAGAELVPFSPLLDKTLPEGIGGIYLGGGYPEMHAKALEDNRFLRDEVRRAVEAGMPVYAECGGLMYLGKAIEADRRVSRMAGVFPWTTRLLPKRKALGYREVFLNENCPFLKKGKIRGHEFHYSEMSGAPSGALAYTVSGGDKNYEEGFVYKNALASYIHLHFASNPAFAAGFVKASEGFRGRKS
ncbi:MAG: cobyrinate a,c-diamide synthase [Deltaproteobacteria bacterium]|nr:cobyrinate a,c-diamide synthase [Deltaproteobacteria bacterium]